MSGARRAGFDILHKWWTIMVSYTERQLASWCGGTDRLVRSALARMNCIRVRDRVQPANFEGNLSVRVRRGSRLAMRPPTGTLLHKQAVDVVPNSVTQPFTVDADRVNV